MRNHRHWFVVLVLLLVSSCLGVSQVPTESSGLFALLKKAYFKYETKIATTAAKPTKKLPLSQSSIRLAIYSNFKVSSQKPTVATAKTPSVTTAKTPSVTTMSIDRLWNEIYESVLFHKTPTYANANLTSPTPKTWTVPDIISLAKSVTKRINGDTKKRGGRRPRTTTETPISTFHSSTKNTVVPSGVTPGYTGVDRERTVRRTRQTRTNNEDSPSVENSALTTHSIAHESTNSTGYALGYSVTEDSTQSPPTEGSSISVDVGNGTAGTSVIETTDTTTSIEIETTHFQWTMSEISTVGNITMVDDVTNSIETATNPTSFETITNTSEIMENTEDSTLDRIVDGVTHRPTAQPSIFEKFISTFFNSFSNFSSVPSDRISTGFLDGRSATSSVNGTESLPNSTFALTISTAVRTTKVPCTGAGSRLVDNMSVVPIAVSKLGLSWILSEEQEAIVRCNDHSVNFFVHWAEIDGERVGNISFVGHDETSSSTSSSSYYLRVKIPSHQHNYNVCVTPIFESIEDDANPAIYGTQKCVQSPKYTPAFPPSPIITNWTANSTMIEVTLEEDDNATNFTDVYYEINVCSGIEPFEDCEDWKNASVGINPIFGRTPCTAYLFVLRTVSLDLDNNPLRSPNVTKIVTTTAEIPPPPNNVKVPFINETCMTIVWERPNTYCSISNYQIILKPIDNCYSKTLKKKSSDNNLFVDGLKPYTTYSFTIFAVTKAGKGNPSSSITRATLSANPSAADPSDLSCSSTACTFRWPVQKHLMGPTKYKSVIYDHDNCETEGLRKKTDNSDCNNEESFINCTIKHLEPYKVYTYATQTIIYLDDETPSTVISNNMTNVTESAAPGSPEKFRVNCNRRDEPAVLTWNLPNALNGELEKFIVNFTGIREGKKNHVDSLIVPMTFQNLMRNKNLFSLDIRLLPEFNYTFQINAMNKDVPVQGDKASATCYGQAKAPIPTASKFSSLDVEAGSFWVNVVLTSDIFNDDNGKILNYSIILFEEDDEDDDDGDDDDVMSLRSDVVFWQNAYGSGKKLPYRTTPDNWNPFRDGRSDEMCCEGNSTVVFCVIGCKECEDEMTEPCNGPLRFRTKYGLFLRAFTAGGYGDTKVLRFRTSRNDEDDASSTDDSDGSAVAIVFSILVIVILAVAAFAFYKRDDIKLYIRVRIAKTAANCAATTDAIDNTVIENSTNTRPVELNQFLTHCRLMNADSGLKFSQEFDELKAVSPTFPQTAAQLLDNRPKNRWVNILPFDHSRVKLLANSDDISTDYINACYIPGFNSQREYIATQGPLPATKDDFWRMVWEQSSQMIVMVTQCVERGKPKCETYWPEDRDVHHYGDLAVQLRSESILSHFTIRIFDVHLGERSLEVKQMHFTKWPDFGCPENTKLLINFIQAVREHSAHGFVGPYIVHCSAGVGRTGTFIAVDRLMQHIRNHTFVDIYGLVLEMRQFRMNMVQTEDQYIYIHSCLRDMIMEAINEGEPIYANVTDRESQM